NNLLLILLIKLHIEKRKSQRHSHLLPSLPRVCFAFIISEDTTSATHSTTYDTSALLNTTEGLEIHVEMPSKQRRNKDKKQQDLELALKRKLNRDLKERYFHLHKTSLLCCFARSYRYNRMLNDTPLMQAALKLLPSSNAYPPERGTEIKYFQSMVTWYKTAVKLASPNLYGEKVRKSRRRVKRELLAQIKRKEASCKQDFVFIFVVLLRAMGLQCRLIVNMQPLPLRPAQSDLLTIKMKRDGDKKEDEAVDAKKARVESGVKAASEKIEKLHVGSADKAVRERGLKSGEKNVNEEKKNWKGKGDKVSGKEGEKIQGRGAKEKERKEMDASKDNTSDKKRAVRNKGTEKEKEQPPKKSHREHKKAPSAKLAELKQVEKLADSEKFRSELKSGSPEVQQTKDTNKKAVLYEKEPQKEEDKIKIYNSNREDTVKHAQLTQRKPQLSRLNRDKKAAAKPDAGDLSADKPGLIVEATPIARRTRKASTEKAIAAATKSARPVIQIGSPKIPKIIIQSGKTIVNNAVLSERENQPRASGSTTAPPRARSRSKSPKLHISPTFLQSTNYRNKFPESTVGEKKLQKRANSTRPNSKSPVQKVQISTDFLLNQHTNATEPAATRILRSRQKPNEVVGGGQEKLPTVPQLDGADDCLEKVSKKKRPKLEKLKQKSHSRDESDEDFEPSPPKQPKKAPKVSVKKAAIDRRVLSSDEEESKGGAVKRNPTAADIWVEVWSDAEEQWVCIELFKGKLHSVEAIRKAASSSFAYVFAFQNDLSIKDVTARYCPNWATTVRKSRVERAWLEAAFGPYYGQRTQRDIREDQEMRRIHEEKPMPTAIADFKDHPLYALERHLLKFQAIYPPDPPTLGFIRGEAVYARECVHTLHSREIWLKQARTVKLGEQPYKIVKARPKWDRLTQTVIKDQPLEIFGYWQTEDYEPPTAENGLVPRNAYGNVELFKECMLPKKTVHLRLPGLNRICKKLGVDCAQAVTGFDFHQGACHPTYDGFVVCEEFGDQVTAAWYQDQEEQEKKEQEKYEARVYGNWKKLIKGLLIRERLKKKYNF
ncbi:DNA repair protein complementing XP-C cells homolog, partial [Rhagoletis pomonella]|uniref:DNA repair protein complementing XP-C cells homolog n=1 Tax=Rhagoletis pomonella TaxID=28610 RepID=UPI00177FB6F2